jgi:tRNA threonylcarbamoyladenosine biosynthesis protein TsaE
MKSDAETQQLGARLAHAVLAPAVIYLNGPLGAGKTTFVRGFLRGLGFHEKVKSPTYTIVEPYETEQYEVFHFDLYRLITPDELRQIDLADYFAPRAVCLIEWPEKGGALLPPADIACFFDMMQNESDGLDAARQIRFEAYTEHGDKTLARL